MVRIPSGILGAKGDAAAGLAGRFAGLRVAVGGVEIGQLQRGLFAQDLGTFGDGNAGQFQIQAGALGCRGGVGQTRDGVADDVDVLGTDQAVMGSRCRLG